LKVGFRKVFFKIIIRWKNVNVNLMEKSNEYIIGYFMDSQRLLDQASPMNQNWEGGAEKIEPKARNKRSKLSVQLPDHPFLERQLRIRKPPQLVTVLVLFYSQ